jgi:chromosome segregation ATPase
MQDLKVLDDIENFHNPKSNTLKLIDLKLTLLSLDDTQNSFNNELKKKANWLESIKKLDAHHQQKVGLFKQRTKFFDAYLSDTTNRTKQAWKVINTTRALIDELDETKKGCLEKVEALTIKKNRLEAKLAKFKPFYQFMNDSLALFDNHLYANISQLLARYESLKLIASENETKAEAMSNQLAKLKSDFSFIKMDLSDKLLSKYKEMAVAEEHLRMLKDRNAKKAELYEINLKAFLDKTLTDDLILKSINYIYGVTNRYCKLTNRKTRSSRVDIIRRFKLKQSFNKNDSPKVAYLKQMVSKLSIIENSILELKEFVE